MPARGWGRGKSIIIGRPEMRGRVRWCRMVVVVGPGRPAGRLWWGGRADPLHFIKPIRPKIVIMAVEAWSIGRVLIIIPSNLGTPASPPPTYRAHPNRPRSHRMTDQWRQAGIICRMSVASMSTLCPNSTGWRRLIIMAWQRTRMPRRSAPRCSITTVALQTTTSSPGAQ